MVAKLLSRSSIVAAACSRRSNRRHTALAPLPVAIAIALYGCAGLAAAQERPAPSAQTPRLGVVVVTATRTEAAEFDLPATIDSLDATALHDGQPQINLSEALVRVPGVVARNRQNYAQDLQVSVRGFGARSTFGVRGVRLYADGIPATMPDGQGQLSHFDLGSAQRVEILRGPFSALYGNSSGGVIALFTEDGKPGTALQADFGAGSNATRRAAVKVSGEQGALNYVIAASDLRTDGFRDHSAAQRDTFNAKIRYAIDSDSQLTLVANALDMPETDDPLGLTREQFKNNPRQAGTNAELFDTRKSVRQKQLGFTYKRQFGAADSFTATVYRGQRDTVQYQAIPTAAQNPPTHSGGVIDLARDYWGTDVNWIHRGSLAARPLQITLGFSYDKLDEARAGYQNFVGASVGVRGALRRNESNDIYNFDQYLQAEWEPGARWLLAAGVRNSAVRMRSHDRYIVTGNGDDSGHADYNATTPVFGVTYKLTPALNLYAAYGEGFETPTMNELAYRSTTGALTGLNFGLKPSRSEHYELGLKAALGTAIKVNVAAFHSDTRDELAVLANASGRSVFQNAGKTRRQGVEASLDGRWDNGLGVALAYTVLRATYAEDFSSCPGSPCVPALIEAGNRIPGVPATAWYGEVSWRHAPSGFSLALEARSESKVYVNDTNSDAAGRYTVANLRAGFEQAFGAWRLGEFVRVDNLGDRDYAGSVIVNESNGRFFEPAPGRNVYAGLSANYRW